MAYNPALEQLRKQAEQRLYQKRLQERLAREENFKMKSLLDPLLNLEGRKRLNGDNWFDTTIKGYQQLFDRNYVEWFRNPGNALINTLTSIGDTLDYAANLIKAPVIAIAKGEDIGTRLQDAYGLGDKGRISQNMSELREVIGAAPSGILGGTATGTLIGAQIGGPWGALIGAGVGLVAGTTAGIAGEHGQTWGNTITDMALEYVVDPANLLGSLGAIKTASNATKMAGASDDVVKLAKTGVKELAQQTALQSSKNFDDFVKGARQGIDATSSLDHLLYMSAKKAVSSNADDAAKVFKRYKNKLIRSYHEGNFDDFQAVLSEIDMFKLGSSGEQVFDMAKARQVFDVLEKDAGLSRAYKVATMFDRFDTKLSKDLLKSTPMGIATMAFKKGLSGAKRLRTKQLAKAFLKSVDEIPEVTSEVQNEVFKKLDDLGIAYKQTGEMDSNQVIELYNSMKLKAEELKANGDSVTAAVLSKQADRLIFDDGVHKVNVISVRSDLNFLVSKYIEHRGDISKIIKDEAVGKAYKNITNLLYYSVGEDVLIDYITKMGYNTNLFSALKHNKQFKELAKSIGSAQSSGAHLIIANIMGGIAKHDLEMAPAQQYVKTLESISKKVLSDKQGVLSAEKQLRGVIGTLQRNIKTKYGSLKAAGSITKELEIEYANALLKVGKKQFDDSIKNYLEPKAFNIITNAKHINDKVQKIRAIQQKNLEDFVEYSKGISNNLATQLDEIKKINQQIVKFQAPSEATREATSNLLAMYKQNAKEAIEAAKAGDSGINKKALQKFDEEVARYVKQMLDRYELDLDDIVFSSVENAAANAHAAKLYKLMDFVKGRIVEDKDAFLKELNENYNAQLAFIAKYENGSRNIRDYLQQIINSKVLKDIDKYLSKFKTHQKRAMVDAMMKNLRMAGPTSKILDNTLILNLTKLCKNGNFPVELADMLNDLSALTKFNLDANNSLTEAFKFIESSFRAAMLKKRPLDFTIGYLRNSLVLKDIKGAPILAELFNKHFKEKGIPRKIINDLTVLLNEYLEIGESFVLAKDTTIISKYLDDFADKVNTFIVKKWQPYSTYVYLSRHINDLEVLNDLNFGYSLKETIKVINELAKDTTKAGRAMQRSVILRYSEQLKDMIDSRLIFKDNLESDLYRMINDPIHFNKFLNDMTTVVKSLRTLEYIIKALQIPNKRAQIKEAISSIDIITRHLMDVFEYSIDYAKPNIALKLDVPMVKDKISTITSILDYIYNSVESETIKAVDEFKIRIIKLPKQFVESASPSYLKGIGGIDLTKQYADDGLISESFKFLEVDGKVVKLVTEYGTIDLPDDLDIDIVKMIKADLETKLIFTPKPTPEDVVQIAFTSSRGKQNIIILNDRYTTAGNKDLLSEDIVKGNVLDKSIRDALVSGAIGNTTLEIDGNVYTFYASRELAFKAVWDTLKENVVSHNGKNYIGIIGQNSTKFDDHAILNGLNKYAGANLAGIVSEDTLPYVRLFQGLAQVKDRIINKPYEKINSLQKEYYELNDQINSLYEQRQELINSQQQMLGKVYLDERVQTLDKIRRNTQLVRVRPNFNKNTKATYKLKFQQVYTQYTDALEAAKQKIKNSNEYKDIEKNISKIDNDIYELKNSIENINMNIESINQFANINPALADILEAIKDLPNAQLGDIYEALKNYNPYTKVINNLQERKALIESELPKYNVHNYDELISQAEQEIDGLNLEIARYTPYAELASSFRIRQAMILEGEEGELFSLANQRVKNAQEQIQYLRKNIAFYQNNKTKLQNYYAELKNLEEQIAQAQKNYNDFKPLVADITGNAHDASYDIIMTEEILNALHRALGEDIKSVKQVKELLHRYSNALNVADNEDIYTSIKAVRSEVNKVSSSIDDDYSKNLFDVAVGRLDKLTKKLDYTKPESIVAVNKFLDDYNYFYSRLEKNMRNEKDPDKLNEFLSTYGKLNDTIGNLEDTINIIKQVREAALKGIFGDSLVQPRPSSYWIMDKLTTDYNYIRNNELFLKLWDIYKGEDIDVNEFSLAGLVKRFKQQYGSTKAYQMHMEKLTNFYNYTERVDAFTQFNIAINEIFNAKYASAPDDVKLECLEAFNRIQDKLFGFGTKDDTLSFDGWLRRVVNEQKKGYLLDVATGEKAAAQSKFNLDEMYVKEEIKKLIVGEGMLSDTKFFKDVYDDLILLDPSGKMYSIILDYINDCIDNIGKYNVYNRDGNALTLLKPVADAQYWNEFRNAYNDILDGYKFAKGGAVTKSIESGYDLGHTKTFDGDTYQAEGELLQFMQDARSSLSEVTAEFDRCKAIGPVPDGFINEKYDKNMWQINSSHQKITYSHNGRTKEYYVNTKIRDLFYDNMGIKFDPKKEMDVITYKKEEPAAIKAIQALRDDAHLYINELYEIINEFNFNGMEYKLPKIEAYSKYYDEILEANPEEFKVYSNFAETMFKTTFGYLPEAKQLDAALRSQYEQMFKAIAVTAYIKKVDSASVYDILQNINRKIKGVDDIAYLSTKKSLNEAMEQILDMFRRADGSYDYEAMHYYITHNTDLEFTIMFKSDKYFKKNQKGNVVIDEATGQPIALHEIQTINIESPAELQRFVEAQEKISKNLSQEQVFSVTDKHTMAIIRNSIGQVANNRVYKSELLNRWVAVRKWINQYIMAPMKSLSLYNIGFTVTNLLEGMLKTFIGVTGSRISTAKQYFSAMKMHKNWMNLNDSIAKAVQGSLFWSTRDQLKLLENEELIGKALFDNWEDILNGAAPKLSARALSRLHELNLPKYIIDKFRPILNKGSLDVNKYAERFKRVHKVYTEELPKYNLDEFKATANFINSPAAAAEFQNIKKSAELNLIGRDKDDNIIQQQLNKFLYSDKWMGEHNPLRAISPYANLSRNSDIELINRYAMYLDMVEKGYTKNEALNKVLATHFNYSNKSNLELSLELLFPFISFPLRNFLYWSNALEEHPELLKVFIDMTMCNWGDEVNNPYNQTKITKGGIRLWGDVSVETGLSAFDAMAFGGNTLNVLTQRKLNPLVSVAIEGAKQLVVGQSNLNYRLQRLPIISHTVTASNLVNSLQKGKVNLYDIAPSLFNEVYKNNRFYYNNQGRYAYKSAYSRLYTSTGYNRFNGNKINAIKNRVIR